MENRKGVRAYRPRPSSNSLIQIYHQSDRSADGSRLTWRRVKWKVFDKLEILRKAVGVAIIASWATFFFILVLLDESYMQALPDAPVPSTGNVHRLSLDRANIRYATREQAWRYETYQSRTLLFGFALMISSILWIELWRMTHRSESDQGPY